MSSRTTLHVQHTDRLAALWITSRTTTETKCTLKMRMHPHQICIESVLLGMNGPCSETDTTEQSTQRRCAAWRDLAVHAHDNDCDPTVQDTRLVPEVVSCGCICRWRDSNSCGAHFS